MAFIHFDIEKMLYCYWAWQAIKWQERFNSSFLFILHPVLNGGT